MNWEALGAVGELVGAIAVVGSLVYVAAQIRQNTRAVRGATYDSFARWNNDFQAQLVADPHLSEVWEIGVDDWDALDADDQRRLNHLLLQSFRFWENAFYQWEQGMLEPVFWDAWWRVTRSWFWRPGVQTWWQTRRAAFSVDFVRQLESSEPLDDPIRTRVEAEEAGAGPAVAGSTAEE